MDWAKLEEEFDDLGCDDVYIEFDPNLGVFKSRCVVNGKIVEGRGDSSYHAALALKNSILVAQRATT